MADPVGLNQTLLIDSLQLGMTWASDRCKSRNHELTKLNSCTILFDMIECCTRNAISQIPFEKLAGQLPVSLLFESKPINVLPGLRKVEFFGRGLFVDHCYSRSVPTPPF
jgi:hypothetical protein